MTEKKRELVDICMDYKDNKGFSIELLGNVLCNLAKNRPVDCKYCVQDRDHNNMYRCINQEYASKNVYEDNKQ